MDSSSLSDHFEPDPEHAGAISCDVCLEEYDSEGDPNCACPQCGLTPAKQRELAERIP